MPSFAKSTPLLAPVAAFLFSPLLLWATPWFDAVREGNLDKVENLVKAGADLEAKNEWEGTALAQAIWSGRTEITKLLLARGANPNTSGKYGTPLCLAIQKWDKPAIRLLLIDPRTDAGIRTPNGLGVMRLMKYSSNHFDREISKLLLKRGASINETNGKGMTPLMRACWVGSDDWVSFLLTNGADIHAINFDGETAYIKAAQRGRLTVMVELEKRGGKVPVFLNRSSDIGAALTATQRWALAAGAILSQSNGENHEALTPAEITADERTKTRQLLRDYWLAGNRAQLIERLENLEHSQVESEKLAWDLCRYANVARWGVTGEYISETEAWDGMLRVARRIQGTFHSWAEMAESYQNGRLPWLAKTSVPAEIRKSHDEAAFIVSLLLNEQDANSPWTKNKWETDLGKAGNP